jgi:hypothetical protein
MSEMVERAALAMAHRKDWNDFPQESAWAWRHAARTAIEALREPTEAMIEAAEKWDSPYEGESGIPADAETHWQAMIDAALKPSNARANPAQSLNRAAEE